jgi:hypothetical protein
MALREIDESGRVHDVKALPHQGDFDRVWLSMTAKERTGIEAELPCEAALYHQ